MKTLVTVVTIIGLSAMIGSIIVGRMVFEGKVIDKPYETGLRYDEMEKAKAELSFKMVNKEFHKGENEIFFLLEDSLGRPVTEPHPVFIISRPATTIYDRQYKVSLVGQGKYMVKVDFPLYGYWDIRISITKEGKSVILEKRIYVHEPNIQSHR